jgi:hypothetical protein
MEPNHYIDLTPREMAAQWADLAWLPIGMIVAAPRHRLFIAGYVGACVFTLRAQIEMMATTGHPRGIMHLLDGDPLLRGQIAYGIVTAVFFAMVFASRKAHPAVALAASLVVYLMAFCISMVILAI